MPMELVVRSKGCGPHVFPGMVVFSNLNDSVVVVQMGGECPADTSEMRVCAWTPTISALVYIGYIIVYFCHYGLAEQSTYDCKLLQLDGL